MLFNIESPSVVTPGMLMKTGAPEAMLPLADAAHGGVTSPFSDQS